MYFFGFKINKTKFYISHYLNHRCLAYVCVCVQCHAPAPIERIGSGNIGKQMETPCKNQKFEGKPEIPLKRKCRKETAGIGFSGKTREKDCNNTRSVSVCGYLCVYG